MSNSSIHRVQKFLIVVTFVCLQLVSQAGEYEETVMQEKPIKEEATMIGGDYLLRMFSMPPSLGQSYPYVIKISMTSKTKDSPATGKVFIKVRLGMERILQQSRPLTEEEIGRIADLIYGEELFSLPSDQKEILQTLERPISPIAGRLSFQLIESRTFLLQERVRNRQTSRPAARIAEAFATLFDDLIKTLEKEEAQK